ncbi:MAG: precorrin-3B C(17)-methyltransferase [Clostridiales bacterium]|jgi:precorrin-3B C17-methyltransferase|nr:precorrin-3B C(17)-methyltransferase [Clostridiales bacterium]
MGRLTVIGFGPGNFDNMTEACKKAVEQADIVVGYSGYISLLKKFYPDKTYHETGMTGEVARCKDAIDYAASGENVCVVSSGDSGVYGMACLIFELSEGLNNVDIAVIPGITAALSGGALLGAPLSNDFAVISLSDLLTPWETIEKRLRAAAIGDFAICLYNPGSKTRTGHLCCACDILLETLPEDRICGLAKNIGREGQGAALTTLKNLRDTGVSMTETVFIGNSLTKIIDGRMVTPRGYKNV